MPLKLWRSYACIIFAFIAVNAPHVAQGACFEAICGNQFIEVGNPLISTYGSYDEVAALDSTTIAITDRIGDSLTTFSWDGTDWSQVGSSITTDDAPVGIVALDNTTVAVIADTPNTIKTYSWSGSSWSQVGNGFTTANDFNTTSEMTALDSNTIVFFEGPSNGIGIYDWDGTDWSQVNFTAIAYGHSMAAISSTTVATTGSQASGLTYLTTLSWNGSSWSQIGSTLNTGVYIYSIAYLGNYQGDDIIVAFEDTNETLSTYRWDGATWSLVQVSDIPNSLFQYSDLTALDQATIVFVESGQNKVVTFQDPDPCPGYVGTQYDPPNPYGSCTKEGEINWDTTNATYVFCDGSNYISMSSTGNYGSCSGQTISALDYDATEANYRFCDGTNWIAFASAGITGSCSTAREIEYDSANNVLTWCDGSNWISAEGGESFGYSPPQCVFVTSTTGKGGWHNSAAEYDAECQARAYAAGHTGVYKAWISYSGAGGAKPANDFVQAAEDYVLPDGTVVANGWSDLVDGTLDNGINLQEDGSATSATYVWTGTTSGGGTATENCSDWGSGGGGSGPGSGAEAGDIGSTTSTWTDGTNHKCGSSLPIMCFEQ